LQRGEPSKWTEGGKPEPCRHVVERSGGVFGGNELDGKRVERSQYGEIKNKLKGPGNNALTSLSEYGELKKKRQVTRHKVTTREGRFFAANVAERGTDAQSGGAKKLLDS